MFAGDDPANRQQVMQRSHHAIRAAGTDSQPPTGSNHEEAADRSVYCSNTGKLLTVRGAASVQRRCNMPCCIAVQLHLYVTVWIDRGL